jgi:hypothetical protein
MNNPTVQDVFIRFYKDFLDYYIPSTRQVKAATHIINCKTGAYGSTMSVCECCGHKEFHHNSCRDRACPMCQEFQKEKWLDAQREFLLDTDYYHIVFTVPHNLNPIFYCNQRSMYTLLFQSAADALTELAADSKYLGAKTGFISILHTWGSNMEYHPHLHLLSLSGGLSDERYWCDKENDYFLPVKVLSSLFRGKFLAGFKSMIREETLVFEGSSQKYRNHYELQGLIDECYQKGWVAFIKESFAGAETVMEYLGRYTHRIAISNSRIISMNDNNVTIKVKDYKNGGVWKELVLSGVEFIRRFLMHVLPKRFVKIRHYGLLGNRSKRNKIPICRNLMGCKKYLSKLKGLENVEIMKILYGIDMAKCPHCGGMQMTKQVKLKMNQKLCNTA